MKNRRTPAHEDAGCSGPSLTCAASACLAAAAMLLAPPAQAQADIPVDFVHLTDLARTVRLDIRYHGSANFMGRPARGYHAPTCILTMPAARHLEELQRELLAQGLSLKIFDCYRPQATVNDFVLWSKDPEDQANKAAFYPEVAKETLIERGYIAERSAHSRGSTVDLTLMALPPADGREIPVQLPTRGALLPDAEVDMGTAFDLFDVKSSTDNPDLPEEIRHNRQFLKGMLEKHGFRNLPEEWWHYTLGDEPYPDTYFNFPVR